jgi:hypothetical protein
MNLLSYDYVVKDPEPETPPVVPEPESTAYIMILCSPEENPELLAEDLQAHIGGRSIEVYKRA